MVCIIPIIWYRMYIVRIIKVKRKEGDWMLYIHIFYVYDVWGDTKSKKSWTKEVYNI